jgi:putative aminopeptidase FrvX
MTLPPVDESLLLRFLVDLLKTPSPTGFSEDAIALTERVFRAIPGVKTARTRKGALLVTLEGAQAGSTRALAAHVDTLGAMVKSIKPSGRLALTRIGGYSWNTVEGEGCTVFTREGRRVRGSILVTAASSHVHGEKTTKIDRSDETMEVRLDAKAVNAAETRALGIEVGDFIAIDPRVELVNGFVRSRHLDDKAGVACLVEAVRALRAAGLKPAQTTHFFISNFEEVGHGASNGLPEDITELVVVDMAAIGDGQNSDEFHATLCVKDSSGPYHYGLSNHLRKLADENAIPYRVDIYPYYGSDGSAFWRAGGEAVVALIGPGIDASHNYERTHIKSLVATTNWVLAYMIS